MCESHVYRHKTLISLIEDIVWICESGVRNYFSPLTHKSRQIVLQHMIYSENSIQFPLKYSKKALKDDIIRKSKGNQNTLKLLSFEALEVLKGCRNIYGCFWQRSVVFRKSSDIAGVFS